MTGKVRIGVTVMTSSGRKADNRAMLDALVLRGRPAPVRMPRGHPLSVLLGADKARRAASSTGPPRSAQVAAGNRAVGRVALRVWTGLWVVLALVALLALVWRSGAVARSASRPRPSTRPTSTASACRWRSCSGR